MAGKKGTKKAVAPPPAEDNDNIPDEDSDDVDDGDVGIGDGPGGFPGDPKQDEGERREIRKTYRGWTTDIQNNRHEYLAPGNNGITDILLGANHLFGNVKYTREAAYDSTLVASLSDLGRQKAQTLNTDFKVFNPGEFSTKLTTFLSEGSLDDESRRHVTDDGWKKLGKAAQPFLKRSPPLHLLFGSFVRGEPVRKPVKEPRSRQVDKDSNAGPSAPRQLKDFSEMQKQETTTAEVERIGGILSEQYNRDNYPICYFKFVVNPESFGQTIENIFYASFLVRDGYARMMLDEDKLPVIEPVEQPEGDEAPPQRSLPHHQVIMSITKPEYLEIVETFNIRTPMIPTREAVNPNLNNHNGMPNPNDKRKGGKGGKGSRR